MPTAAGQVGLNCPHCGANLRAAYVAKSHPTAGGQRRTRYCPECHEVSHSLEYIVAGPRRGVVVDFAGVEDSAQRLIRALLRELKVDFIGLDS